MVTFPIRTLVLSGFLALFAFHFSFGQVVFKEVPDYEIRSFDSLFFDLSETRSLILLNGKCSVRPANDDQAQKVIISVPSIFEGEGELIFLKRRFQKTH
jgi:hypothetical protein